MKRFYPEIEAQRNDEREEHIAKIVALPVGTKVYVNDGTELPPLRFTRKVADWRARNYIAEIAGQDAYDNGRGCVHVRKRFNTMLVIVERAEKITLDRPASWPKE